MDLSKVDGLHGKKTVKMFYLGWCHVQMVADRREKCCSCDLFFAGDVEYEILERRVMDDDVRHNVNMRNETCTCRQWQLDGVPCIHAMTAIAHRREKHEDYCHICYNVTTYKTRYESIIHHLPD